MPIILFEIKTIIAGYLSLFGYFCVLDKIIIITIINNMVINIDNFSTRQIHYNVNCT
jgi:hypothetical protein